MQPEMTITTKLLIIAAVAVGELLALWAVARAVPAQRRGPILPVVAISSILTLSLVGYFLFYFL